MIRGNTEGIRQSVLEELERLYETDWARDQFLPDRLLNVLVHYTDVLNREIMVYMTRDGNVLEISIGSAQSVALPERSLRRNVERLSGIRCIHTHPGGNARLSDIDEQALRLLRFDAMCAIGVDQGIATGITAAFLGEMEYGQLSIHVHGPVKPGRVPQEKWLREIEVADERVLKTIREGNWEKTQERVLLVSTDSDESLDELESLTNTAGAVVIQRVLQKRLKPDPSTYIGSGKVSEIALLCQAAEIDLVIFDDELTASQNRNVSEILGAGVRVIDRTALILDIFAQRAQSHEGKLQVELAQMKYNMPLLQGLGTVLSRLGGGIGTRGPGETQLEVDRRRIRRRVNDLEKELAELDAQRTLRRRRREKTGQLVAALVGYTNAGKSTIMKALSGADVFIEDKLFATLDPVMRKIDLPNGGNCILVDTVGFIRKLPHQLIEAFKSTLEEALFADLIIIVSDASHERCSEQRETVHEVLNQLGASDKPMIEVLNKCDRLPDVPMSTSTIIAVSAVTGSGLDDLLLAIQNQLSSSHRKVRVSVPYAEGQVLAVLHSQGKILTETYTDACTVVECQADTALINRVERMLKNGSIEIM
ncbi:MAG: GTPase HflX [Clostridia bacterium]|nr:GTPase HflX [Clostridia bacterium]